MGPLKNFFDLVFEVKSERSEGFFPKMQQMSEGFHKTDEETTEDTLLKKKKNQKPKMHRWDTVTVIFIGRSQRHVLH